MIIDGLPVMSSPQSGDEIPIERGTATYKIDYDALATAIISKLGDPVGVSHGGSGLAVSPSLLVNLASANADTVMKQSPRPGVYGVLPIANGGSGLSASPSVLVNLASNAADNIMKDNPRPGVTGTLPVANGGTGRTTASEAFANLSSSQGYNGNWKTAPVGMSIYYYDTTSPATYDLPSGGSLVLVVRNASTNGFALCVKYTAGAKLLSMNRLSGGNWLGWTTVFLES